MRKLNKNKDENIECIIRGTFGERKREREREKERKGDREKNRECFGIFYTGDLLSKESNK